MRGLTIVAQDGIEVDRQGVTSDGGSSSLIEDNRIIGLAAANVATYGVFLYLSDENVVRANYIAGFKDGVHIGTTCFKCVGLRAQSNRIESNTLTANYYAGLEVGFANTATYADATTITGNHAWGNAVDGLFVSDSARNSVIAGNVADRNGHDGINAGGVDSTISGNHISVQRQSRDRVSAWSGRRRQLG